MLDSTLINLFDQAIPTKFDQMVLYKQSESHRSVRHPLQRQFDESRRKRLNDRLESVILRERVHHPSDPALEINDFRRCMNDVIGMLAVPLCSGREPVEILSTLVDSLMEMLALDFIYARVIVEAGEKPLEVLKAGPLHRTEEIAQSLDGWLNEDQIDRLSQTRRKIGKQDVSIFPMRMGVEFDLGFIVAGSRRFGFPELTERLVLGVAANQTAALLQQALLLSEQERVASELDRRVTERTRELAETNKELQLQAGLLQHLPVSAWTLKPDGTPDFVNQVWLEFAGQTVDFVRSHPEAWMTAVHPEDREAALRAFWDGVRSGQGFAVETRSLRAQDGTYRWHLNQAVALRDAEGKVLKFVGTTTDIDDQKRAEEKIRQSEKEARQLLDLSPLHITELRPDGARLYTNRASLDYYGVSLEEWQNADLRQALHPQDAALLINELPARFQSGLPFEYETRLKRKDGQHRWFHYRLCPTLDEQGRITRWYAAGTDIDDRKVAEQRLQQENVSLREEIDKASMFEEIVGTSASLKKVISRISKVAPTDSSVLITGETGTGKELVARAIHRRSRRSRYPFVSLNCAAIPRDLIASELFGHEKGAFTGATQRRLGRFELAAGGTLFLDEVGELPAETQVALLRVLQEREFERVGGTGSVRVDVRVIAATNRDLEEAIRASTFRSDLFYRLNVFPIEVPTLRQRKEDIPLLVEYFLDRYGRKAGKNFKSVDKRSLELLQSYPWPGNIRELQNVIERSVIVGDMEVFSVDESWLSRRPLTTEPEIRRDPFRALPSEEKSIIEAALRECGGRVYGPAGAAEKLGVPRSTLESKIRTLKINKNRFARMADGLEA